MKADQQEPWAAIHNATTKHAARWKKLDDCTRRALIAIGWKPREWDTAKLADRYAELKRLEDKMIEQTVNDGDADYFNFRSKR